MIGLDSVSGFLRIILLDLVLSGDNAVVIGLAASRISAANRRRAIVLGGGMAVVMRIVFTILAAVLLDIPLLEAFGGVLLFYIAYKLIQPADEGVRVAEADTLSQAVRTILLANLVMSLDNILAVAAAADGDLWLLLFGLLLSIPLLLIGSDVVARLLHRVPALVYAGVLVLVHTAIHMVNSDDIVSENIGELATAVEWVLAVAITGAMMLYVLKLRRPAETAPAPESSPSTPAR